jgi:hypothetical protein
MDTAVRPSMYVHRIEIRALSREMSRCYCGGFKANRKSYAADPEYKWRRTDLIFNIIEVQI